MNRFVLKEKKIFMSKLLLINQVFGITNHNICLPLVIIFIYKCIMTLLS